MPYIKDTFHAGSIGMPGVSGGDGNAGGRKQGVGRGKPPGTGRVRVAGAGRLQIVMSYSVERQFAVLYQLHQLAGQIFVELVSLHQKCEHGPVGNCQRKHDIVDLGQPGIAGNKGRQFPELECIANRHGKRPFNRLRSIGMAPGLRPGQLLLHAHLPGVADGLAGVSARPVRRGAVKQGKKLFIHAPAEIRFVIAAPLDQGAKHEPENDARLRELACLEALMVASGPGVGVSRDPPAVVAMQFLQVIIPVGTEAEGIPDEGAHDGAGGSVPYGGIGHGVILLFIVMLRCCRGTLR
jgi:hypothetical protein